MVSRADGCGTDSSCMGAWGAWHIFKVKDIPECEIGMLEKGVVEMRGLVMPSAGKRSFG